MKASKLVVIVVPAALAVLAFSAAANAGIRVRSAMGIADRADPFVVEGVLSGDRRLRGRGPRGRAAHRRLRPASGGPSVAPERVGDTGLEPVTSALSRRRSPS